MTASPISRSKTFDELFISEFPRVRRIAAKVVGLDSAEDVTVEAFARAFARWNTVGSMEYPGAWVIRVATNLALDQVRRKTPKVLAREVGDSQQDVVTRDTLLRSLRRLPRRQQEVVVLRYIVDMSEAEVGQTLDINVGTVKTHLHRALPRLRIDLDSFKEGDST
jgi:RNA polymerase sigma factor (sigma-70 family)